MLKICMCVVFNIESLYTNIPVVETINIILSRVFTLGVSIFRVLIVKNFQNCVLGIHILNLMVI